MSLNLITSDALFAVVDEGERGALLQSLVDPDIVNGVKMTDLYTTQYLALRDLLVKSSTSTSLKYARTKNGAPFIFFTEAVVKIRSVDLENVVALPGVLAGLSLSAQTYLVVKDSLFHALNESQKDTLTHRYDVLMDEARSLAISLDVMPDFFRHMY
jgi:hypothetical protein